MTKFKKSNNNNKRKSWTIYRKKRKINKLFNNGSKESIKNNINNIDGGTIEMKLSKYVRNESMKIAGKELLFL